MAGIRSSSTVLETGFLMSISIGMGISKREAPNLRSTLKRMTRKFLSDGGIFKTYMSHEGVEEAIVAYQDVYQASWKVPEPYPNSYLLLSSLLFQTECSASELLTMLVLGLSGMTEHSV